MSAQSAEILFIGDNEYMMFSEPLYPYLLNREVIPFKPIASTVRRGYTGKWKIIDDKLYLIELTLYLEGNREASLDYLFPGQKQVFANWFSGFIRIPLGNLIQYEHLGYASIYQADLFIEFGDGIKKSEHIINNEEQSKNPQTDMDNQRDKSKQINDKKTIWGRIFRKW